MASLVAKLKKLEKGELEDEALENAQRTVIDQFSQHPIVQEAYNGNPDAFLEEVLELDQTWTGVKWLYPRKKKTEHNIRVAASIEITGYARDFRRDGLTAHDNPAEPATTYGGIMAAIFEAGQWLTPFDEFFAAYMAVAGVTAGVVGLVKGGYKALNKMAGRKLTKDRARWLSGVFENLYGRRESLIETVDRLSDEMLPGEERDEALRAELVEFADHPLFNQEEGRTVKENYYALMEAKWLHELTLFPKFFGAWYPSRKDQDYNDRLKVMREVLPEAVDGFKTEGLMGPDSPIGRSLGAFVSVKALGLSIDLILPFIGVDMGPEASEIYAETVDAIAYLSVLYSGFRGIGPARAKHALRMKTTEQVERLSGLYQRLVA